ncbi:MAG: glycyl-radical enzyme activating protein [Victivallales bacterium]|nr:glycyl-radical enzyme activating protein [Victivallales bacterium]
MTLVSDIEKFAVHDGPGIRTVVFLKGCPLACRWCHNPESQSFAAELYYDDAKCMRCRRCAAVCPRKCHAFGENGHHFDRTWCLHCGRCTTVCPVNALEMVGREMTIPQVLEEVLADQVFYDHSGGGLTLSGGEPLAHFDFTRELLSAAKNAKLHTCVETSGFAPWEHVEPLLPLVDLWLWDIKAPPELHERLIGVPDDLILENLHRLDVAGGRTVLRCPLIPGLNDSEAALLFIAELANSLKHLTRIDLEPYHPLGESKNARLGKERFFHAPFVPETTKTNWQEFLMRHTHIEVHI